MPDFPEPLLVGSRSEPRICALLDEMAALFAEHGVDGTLVRPIEVTCMRKSPGRAIAIPPRSTWPRMATTLREVFVPLRRRLGVPLSLVGYRPPDYNAAVGGKPGSRHQAFQAIDIRVVKDHATPERRRALALEAAALFIARGRPLRMGLGVYGCPTPGNIHVDTGWARRTWNDAPHFLDQARAAEARARADHQPSPRGITAS